MIVIRVFILGASVLVLTCCRGQKSENSQYGAIATNLVQTTGNALERLPDSWPGTKAWNTTCHGLFPRNMTEKQRHSLALRVSRKYVELLLDVYNESQHLAGRLFDSCRLDTQVWDTIQKTEEHLNASFISGNFEEEPTSFTLTKDAVKTLEASNVFEMIQSFGECIIENRMANCSGIVLKECADTKKEETLEPRIREDPKDEDEEEEEEEEEREESMMPHQTQCTCVCSTPTYHQSDVKTTSGLAPHSTTLKPTALDTEI